MLIGREFLSWNCLPANSSGIYNNGGGGAVRCAKLHCIDRAKRACVKMGIQTYLARKASDHTCALLNEAVGVDDCADAQNYNNNNI